MLSSLFAKKAQPELVISTTLAAKNIISHGPKESLKKEQSCYFYVIKTLLWIKWWKISEKLLEFCYIMLEVSAVIFVYSVFFPKN